MQEGGDGELREEFCPVTRVLDLLTVKLEDYRLMNRNKNYSLVKIRAILPKSRE